MNAVAAMIDPEALEQEVGSSVLGTLTVARTQLFDFENGLLGFPEARSFALVPARQEGMFWLQSLDFEALTFLMVDPFRYIDGYAVDLSASELGDLTSDRAADILVFAILTLPRRPGDAATANLQGPVALNLPLRRGRQIVLQDSPYGVRHPVAFPVQE